MWKVHRFYSFFKDALREEMTSWLIKCSGKGNLSDVEHFNNTDVEKKKQIYQFCYTSFGYLLLLSNVVTMNWL
jgi:hypothetical protein